MRLVLLCTLIIGCASAQYAKSGVKGGYGGQGYHHRAGESLVSLFGNRTQGSVLHNETLYGQNAVGVCFKEVPTVSLVKDPRHVPAGNGSRPDLSVIRTCCPGYERNIHNHKLCDPVCTKECVNSICTAPETCTCYPDNVRNYAGVCVPTCPIGCQYGQCAGGECICNDGFTLDRDSKYCIPICRENCGGIGNCTGPNICACRSGYQSTPEGSCKPVCNRCAHGDCVAPNDCRCSQGYAKDSRGDCISQCTRACGPSEVCVGPNICAPAAQFIPAQGSQQPYNQGPYSSYPGHRNQTNLPHYPTYGPSQNSTSYIPPDYTHNRPYYPYPGQNPVNPGQTQYPGSSQPNYIVQPVGNQSYSPPASDNLLVNSSTNVTHPYQPNRPGYQSNQPGYPPNQPGYQSNQPGHTTNQPGYQSNTPVYQSNQPGYQPYQPGYRPNQPGYQPNQPAYQPNQPRYQPNQPGYQPNQPGQAPNQPGYQPNNSGYQPNQPGYQPNQPGYQPNQPGYQPNQPGYQPNYPGYHPNQPGYPPNQPAYQPGQYPPPDFNQTHQTHPGSTPNYYYRPDYYQPNSNQSQPGSSYQPMYPNPYSNQNNTLLAQYPYQGNATSNQPRYPQPNYGNPPNVPSYPSSENLTSHQVYPSQNPSPNYKEPDTAHSTQRPYSVQEHTTNQSPNFFNPYNSDYNYQYGQQSVCSPPCINGDCVGQNRCSCHRGYTPDHSDPSGARCKPVCMGGCVNGVCTAPNVCICNEGYSMDTSVKGRMMCVHRIRRSADPIPKKPKSVVDF